MRLYDESLVAILEKNATIESSFGFPIEVKSIPDDTRDGVLDPREFDLALKTLANRAKTPLTIEAIREETHFPNQSINAIEISTSCEELMYNGQSFKLWSYRPCEPSLNKRVAIIYVHGGSFFAGSTDLAKNTCHYMTEKAQAVVFNVDIALAPEQPYPWALNQVKMVIKHVYDNCELYNIDREKIIITGDSSGACIGTVCALGESRQYLKMQVLFYPCTTFDSYPPDIWHENDFQMSEEYKPYILPRLGLGRSDGNGNHRLMNFIRDLYLTNGGNPSFFEISPLNGPLSQAVKTLIFTAEYDGLRPQGEFYASQLAKANVPVRLIRYRGIHHGFIDKIGVFPQAEDAINEMAKEIEKL